MNSLKFIKYTLSEREFHKEDNGDVDFSQKLTILEKIKKKNNNNKVFCHFSFETS